MWALAKQIRRKDNHLFLKGINHKILRDSAWIVGRFYAALMREYGIRLEQSKPGHHKVKNSEELLAEGEGTASDG
jgi:uncharacterized protein YbjT (DUF2867 family)